VLAILGARDHYAAIDVPRDAAFAEVRRCYLKASMLVHPDKNAHPEATRAFQRVSAAWAVLSDSEKRRQYDEELQEGEHRVEVNLTPEEAFVAFAFAAACAAGESDTNWGVSGETLLWMQQLGQLGSCQQLQQLQQLQQRNGFGYPGVAAATTHPGEPSLALTQAASGLAISASIWSAGLVASYAGLPIIGRTARRVALVQCVSQVAMASQVPAIRDAASSSFSGAFQGLARHKGLANLASRVRLGALGGIAAAGELGALVTSSSSSSGSSGYCLSLRAFVAGGGDEERDDHATESWYERNLRLGSRAKRPWKPVAGSWVKLCDLQKSNALEGRLGEVIAFDRSSERYQVRLLPLEGWLDSGDGDVSISKLVLLRNFKPAIDRSYRAPASERQFF